jgi:hypothetical protein
MAVTTDEDAQPEWEQELPMKMPAPQGKKMTERGNDQEQEEYVVEATETSATASSSPSTKKKKKKKQKDDRTCCQKIKDGDENICVICVGALGCGCLCGFCGAFCDECISGDFG